MDQVEDVSIVVEKPKTLNLPSAPALVGAGQTAPEITKTPEALSLDKYLADIRGTPFFQDQNTQGSLDWYCRYYKTHSSRNMWLFRFVGLFVIFFSALLPFASAYSDILPGKTVIVSVLAVIVAIAAGINAFFRWDNNWRIMLNARLELEIARNHWALMVAEARSTSDESKAVEMVKKATEDLFVLANRIIENETRAYISAQNFPGNQSQNPNFGTTIKNSKV